MSKRIAVVTGGMGGIGRAICKDLYENGIHVVAAYSRPHEKAQAWQQEQQKLGYDFDIAYVDVTNFDSCTALAKTVASEIGSIDILINNAGITRDISCSKMLKEDWDIVISTDLNGLFYMTHAVLLSMREQQHGRIINISSVNGQKGSFGQTNYSAAKAGMHGFTKSLAVEVAKKNITVNTVSPGYVFTEMITSLPDDIQQKILAGIPMGRFATPEEVARVVTFLCDEKSSYITGANIAINGGHYMA